jgi:hypothetical protein
MTPQAILLPQPAEELEIDQEFARVLEEYGEAVGGPPALAALAASQKWQIICMYRVHNAVKERAESDDEVAGGGVGSGGGGRKMPGGDDEGSRRLSFLRGADDGYFDGLKSAQLTPALWLDRLRDADAGNRFTLAQAGCLKLQMRASSGSWLDAFYEGGGLRSLIEVGAVPLFLSYLQKRRNDLAISPFLCASIYDRTSTTKSHSAHHRLYTIHYHSS